jgi:hypothetical protein
MNYCPAGRGSIPRQGSDKYVQHRAEANPASLSIETVVSNGGFKLNTQLHLMLSYRIRGSLPPLTPTSRGIMLNQ